MKKIVTTCDRCEKSVTNDERIAGGLGSLPHTYHLCIDCHADFKAWVAKGRKKAKT